MFQDLVRAVPSNVHIGVTDLAPFDEAERRIEERVTSGLSGGLGFVYRAPKVAAHPITSFPWGRSIVVAAVPYLADGDGPHADDDRHESVVRSVARFADGDRYDRVRSALAGIESVLAATGARCEQVYDDDRLIDRAVAVRAGVAWPGKSTMAITPTAGPWFLIGSVVTDLVLEPTEPMSRSCGSCNACMPACPTGAIIAPGVLDARLCLAAVLQRPGSIPSELRSAVGGRVYGCDDCLVACPPGDKVLEALTPRMDQPSPRSILTKTDAELKDLSRHWYVPKRNPRFVRRNALIALGNVGTSCDIGLLAGYLGHPDAMLSEHAAWALESIGGGAAEAILSAEEQLVS